MKKLRLIKNEAYYHCNYCLGPGIIFHKSIINLDYFLSNLKIDGWCLYTDTFSIIKMITQRNNKQNPFISYNSP